MAYRFKLTEAFDEGVRRIGLQQIDRAVAQLGAHEDPAAAVHGTRKCLKRVRALLRLARPGLDPADYSRENICFRDIGRGLATARDRQVLLDTVERLQQTTTGRARTAFLSAGAKLAAEHDGAAPLVEGCVIATALSQLHDARGRIGTLAFETTGFEVAFDGLELGYRKARRALDRARASGDADDIHEWRKRVQHHWRHLMLLSPAWPELAKARIDAARRLSAILGEDHDLALLSAGRDMGGRLKVSTAQQRSIEGVASARQAQLRQEADGLGRLLFAERPSAFRDQMALYWQVAISSWQKA